jgi:hypothetical protein
VAGQSTRQRGTRYPVPTGKVETATAAFDEGTEMTPGGRRGVPVDKYHVVVTQRHVPLWDWEIYRNNEPLPARLWDGPYKSARTAEAGGRVALRKFLEALDRLDGG